MQFIIIVTLASEKVFLLKNWIRSTLIFKIDHTTFDNLYFQKTPRQDKMLKWNLLGSINISKVVWFTVKSNLTLKSIWPSSILWQNKAIDFIPRNYCYHELREAFQFCVHHFGLDIVCIKLWYSIDIPWISF